MSERRSVEASVTGLVQGVGFRYHCQHQAQELGLVGWVRNEADGSVRVHAEGGDDAVEALLAWLRQGPPSASVQRVDVEPADATGATSFDVSH